MTRVAAVDIGTNTILLLVAEQVASDRLTAVVDRCQFARLGQGLDTRGSLDQAAIERSLAILREYRATLDELSVDHIAAVGTQALREAKNAQAFVEPAQDLLGCTIEVISGEREAQLVFRSVAEAFPELATGQLVVADVGGGSTEIIAGSHGTVESLVSVPIGAVRMSERHLKSDPATADETRALMADIDRHLADLDLPMGATLVGTAGTATTLATVEQRLLEYQADRVQGFRIPRIAIDRQVARFLELTLAEKRSMRGLESQRADVIAGGAAIYARLAHRLDAAEMITSDRGVRWGLAHEQAAA